MKNCSPITATTLACTKSKIRLIDKSPQSYENTKHQDPSSSEIPSSKSQIPNKSQNPNLNPDLCLRLQVTFFAPVTPTRRARVRRRRKSDARRITHLALRFTFH